MREGQVGIFKINFASLCPTFVRNQPEIPFTASRVASRTVSTVASYRSFMDSCSISSTTYLGKVSTQKNSGAEYATKGRRERPGANGLRGAPFLSRAGSTVGSLSEIRVACRADQNEDAFCRVW